MCVALIDALVGVYEIVSAENLGVLQTFDAVGVVKTAVDDSDDHTFTSEAGAVHTVGSYHAHLAF